MKIDEKKVEDFLSGVISILAIGVGMLLIATVSVFVYAIVKSIFF